MKFQIIVLIILIFSASTATALDEVIIYLDDKGTAEFFGQTSSQSIQLPDGINLINGKISGKTNQLTNKLGDDWVFSFFLDNADISVRVPSNFKITDTTGEITIDNNPVQRYPISIYSYENISISYKFTEESQTKKSFVIFLIISIVILLGIFLWIFKRNKLNPKEMAQENTKENEKLEIIKKTLNERDNLILDALKKTGKIKSSYLRKYCKIPKASFSRRIVNLEKKGIVKISGEGRNKFVEIFN